MIQTYKLYPLFYPTEKSGAQLRPEGRKHPLCSLFSMEESGFVLHAVNEIAQGRNQISSVVSFTVVSKPCTQVPYL